MLGDDGYAIFKKVVSESECEDMIAAISASGRTSRAGVRNLMSSESVAKLASDVRLTRICRSVFGSELTPYKATLFNKTGKANWLVAWHQDTALPVEREFAANGWGSFTRKAGVIYGQAPTEVIRNVLALRIHLDASTASNGPLRVIPGSHGNRILDNEEFRRIVREGQQVELTIARGGVIVMSPLLIHASSKCESDEPRRVLHIEYALSRDLAGVGKLAIA